jgi:hypothetical protein
MATENRLRGGGGAKQDARRRRHRSSPERPLPTLWSMVFDEDWPYGIAMTRKSRLCLISGRWQRRGATPWCLGLGITSSRGGGAPLLL